MGIDPLESAKRELLEETGQKPGVLFSLIRIYTTWAPFSPQLDATLELLGLNTTISRLAINSKI
jgi:glutamyl-tRNA synthetase